MKKADILEKHWHEYLKWCSNMPDSSATELYKWLTLKDPIEANFWKWVVDVKKGC